MSADVEIDLVPEKPPLLQLRGLSKRFTRPLDLPARIARRLGADLREQVVHAVDHVDLAIAEREVVGLVGESGCGKSTLGRIAVYHVYLAIAEREVVGLVGESGCGKSTLGRIAVGILAPSGGVRRWRGLPLPEQPPSAAREQQLKMQMIFQDPYGSLNPRLRVVDIVGEAFFRRRRERQFQRTDNDVLVDVFLSCQSVNQQQQFATHIRLLNVRN